jgi:hypothetical protein
MTPALRTQAPTPFSLDLFDMQKILDQIFDGLITVWLLDDF